MKIITVDRFASQGIAMGEAFLVQKADITPDNYAVDTNSLDLEIAKYNDAVKIVSKDLEEAAKTSDIFAAHVELVQDISLYTAVKDAVNTGKYNIQQAVNQVSDMYIKIFEEMDDEYMRERAIDMKDIKERLLYACKGISPDIFSTLIRPSIIIAKDLNPSDTLGMDMNYVKGFITEQGGITSHVAIIAKNLGLPALVGVSGILSAVKECDNLILDATEKKIILHPDEEFLKKYKKALNKQAEEQEALERLKDVPALTKDGKLIELCANVGNLEDIRRAKKMGFDGIGLFRSEFLYMENTHFPTEEEQFQVYKEAVLLAGKAVTVRTLDIGGDKDLPYFKFETEENPFLGWRAIRICLDRTDIFKTQLRALLKASAFGDIRIMYPMIICEEELDLANKLLHDCMRELDAEGQAYNPHIKVGIMIETPAAVLCAKELGAKADFFSIGTNDLTQYITAVDRGNKKVAHLYDTKNPGVLKAIKMVIAADETATQMLLGFGLDEFSMSAGSINKIKSIIMESNYEIARKLFE